MSREREPYFGTEFIHVGVIFQAPLPGTASGHLDAPGLDPVRHGQWTARSFEIWMFKWPELVWSFPGFSDDGKNTASLPGNRGGAEDPAHLPGDGSVFLRGVP